MHRSEELGLSKKIDLGMTPEWWNGIKQDLKPALDLVDQHLTSGFKNPGGEYFNLSWPLGHTPYSSKEDKEKRKAAGIYEEIEFPNYILNCNYFRKGQDDEYTVHGILSKSPQFEIGEHVQRYADTIAELYDLQDKYRVMVVMYKGPKFCMQWHTDGYTYNRFQLPIISSPNGQFGWRYTHEDNEIEEVWLSMEEGISYWVNTQNLHIFDNSRPGCTGRIHFMIDYLDWEPYYERNNGKRYSP